MIRTGGPVAPDVPGSGTGGPDGQTVNGAALLSAWRGSPVSGSAPATASGMGPLHGDDSHPLKHVVDRLDGRTLTGARSIQHEVQVGREEQRTKALASVKQSARELGLRRGGGGEYKRWKPSLGSRRSRPWRPQESRGPSRVAQSMDNGPARGAQLLPVARQPGPGVRARLLPCIRGGGMPR